MQYRVIITIITIVCSAYLQEGLYAAPPKVKEAVSDEVLTRHQAFAQKGLRVHLGFGWHYLMAGYKHSSSLAIHIEPAYRFHRHLSVSLLMQYNVLLVMYEGVHWHTTLHLRAHPLKGLILDAGVGYAGIWSTYLNNCEAHGITAKARVGYMIATGSLFATGPYAGVSFDLLRCKADEWSPSHWQRVPSFNLAWHLVWR